MYKLLAMDLDETLFNSEHQIDDGNKEAIAKARAQGIKIVPCSGRGPGFLGSLYDDLDLFHEDEYSILGNGAIVVENKTSKIIACYPLAYKKAKELFDFGIHKQLCVQVFTPEKVYVYQIDDNEKERIKSFGDAIVFMDDLNFEILKDKTILKVLFEKPNSIPYLQSLEPELSPITAGEVTIAYSSDRYLELNAFGIHKGIGLKALADHLNINISETIGVGDSYNDVGLIEDAGLGVAVQNAIDEIKAIASIITEATNNENAIAEVINRFIFNEE